MRISDWSSDVCSSDLCVMPSIAATPLTFDEGHVCSACRVYGQRRDIDWDERRGWLEELVGEYRSERNYDVVIPVSGGKDSYFQTHYAINELGLKERKSKRLNSSH